MTSNTDLSSVINYATYPLLLPQSEQYKELLNICRNQIAQNGACELPHFLSDKGLNQLVRESQKLAEGAFFNYVKGNAYLEEQSTKLPDNHPRNRTEGTSLGVVAYDEYPTHSLLRQIYEFDPLMHFIGSILQLKSIHRYADPMGGLNLSVMKENDYLRWHFDQTDFVTSIAIQTADQGGTFEFVPMIRNDHEEHYEQIELVLNGTHPGIQKIANKPGTLLLFKGRHSIHRVSTIKGHTHRLIGLLAYDEQPGVMSTDHLRKIRYGRSTPKQPLYS